MRKLLFALSLFGLQFVSAQETTERVFNFGPMGRVYGFLPINSGDNYLADANKSKLSLGVNLSPFEVYGFRPYVGVDHTFYDTNNTEMAANVTRTRNTAIYGLISYSIPVVQNLSVEPYLGGGWSGLTFDRSEESDNLLDPADIDQQEGAEFRAGLFVDYKLAPVISVFAGANYIRGSYRINSAPELEDYFGKSTTVQISLGLKIGYTMNDKRKARATASETTK